MLSQWESTDKTIKKNLMKQGVFCKKPTECSTCNVVVENINVIGASVDDLKDKYYTEILDNSHEKLLIIGEANTELDRKIERAIQMMNIHERSLVTITMPFQSKLNTESLIVKFEITLTKCERYKPIWKWSPEEKYSIALRYKEKGVELFKGCRFIDAFYKFSKACKILITLEPIGDLELEKQLESNIGDLRLVLYNNIASCHLNQRNFEHTVALCTKVLEKDQKNVKALYRRGVAYGGMKDIEKAVADLKQALTLEPNNHIVKEQFLIYNTKLQEANQIFNNIVKRMFKT